MKVNTSIVLSILDREDIEGLIERGAPSDEYTDEARLIAEGLEAMPDRTDLEQVVAVVSQVWNRMFGPFSEEQLKRREPALRSIARGISDVSEP